MMWGKSKPKRTQNELELLRENVNTTEDAVNEILMGDIAEQIAAMQEALNDVLMKEDL